MGYESRLYIVQKHNTIDYAEVIARFDCSKMGYDNGWMALFNKPFTGRLYAEDGDTVITEDNYGDSLNYATFLEVIAWLEKEIKNDSYRRLPPLLALLKGFNMNQWNDGEMQIVHFGY